MCLLTAARAPHQAAGEFLIMLDAALRRGDVLEGSSYYSDKRLMLIIVSRRICAVGMALSVARACGAHHRPARSSIIKTSCLETL